MQLWGGNHSQIEYHEHMQAHEAQSLMLDSAKAGRFLQWVPRWGMTDALQKIVAWHQHALYEDNMRAFTVQQIEEYLEEKAICLQTI